MKYIVILLLIAFVSNAQITKEQLNLPWPQDITLTSGTFTITKQFKVNIKGNPDARLFKG
jgi:hexosaminidase